MGFFSNAHNFIIDGPKGDEAGVQGDPRDVANQALARARVQLDAAAAMSYGYVPLPQDSALLASNKSGMEIQRALGGEDLAVRSGGSTFAGGMGGMSGDQKRELAAQLAEMRRQLDARKKRKEEQMAKGEGRFGRQPGQNQGHSLGGLSTRGRGAMTSGPPGRASQIPPMANPTALPPPLGGLTGPPGFPPDFNPNSPEFLQFVEYQKTAQAMGGPGPLSSFSTPPNVHMGSVPPHPPNMALPPPGFDPRQLSATLFGYCETPGLVPPPPQLNFMPYNPHEIMANSAPVSEYTFAVEPSTQSAENVEEASKEDEQEEEALSANSAETSMPATSRPASKSASISAGSPYGSDIPVALSAPPKEKGRRRSSPLRNLFPNSKRV